MQVREVHDVLLHLLKGFGRSGIEIVYRGLLDLEFRRRRWVYQFFEEKYDLLQTLGDPRYVDAQFKKRHASN